MQDQDQYQEQPNRRDTMQDQDQYQEQEQPTPQELRAQRIEAANQRVQYHQQRLQRAHDLRDFALQRLGTPQDGEATKKLVIAGFCKDCQILEAELLKSQLEAEFEAQQPE